MKTINITLTETQVIHLLEGALIFNTTILTAAGLWDRRRNQKIIKQWTKNHEYMTRLSRGMGEIAMRNSVNPLTVKEEIDALMDDIKAEMLLDEIDFSSVMKDADEDS